MIRNLLDTTTDLNDLNLLLKPIAICSSFLNKEFFKSLLQKSISNIISIIQKLEGDDLKDKVSN